MKTSQSNKFGLKLDQPEIRSTLLKFKDKNYFASPKLLSKKSVKIDDYFLSGLFKVGSKSPNIICNDETHKPHKEFKYILL